MILLAISMLGTLNLSVQAAEKDTDFFEEYQDQETLTRIIHGSINSHKIRRSYHYNHS